MSGFLRDWRRHAPLALLIAGAAGIAEGVGEVFAPARLIVAGVAAVALGLLFDFDRGDR